MKKHIMIIGILLTVGIMVTGCGQNVTGTTSVSKNTEKTEAFTKSTGDSSVKMNADAPQPSVQGITEEEAKEIVLKDIGISEEEASFVQVRRDEERGKLVYEVKVQVENQEYEYAVDITNGDIVENSFDIDLDHRDNLPPGVISEEEASLIILNRVEGASREDLKLELDKENNRWIYEGELFHNGMEYEAEINGETGEIIKWKEEIAD